MSHTTANTPRVLVPIADGTEEIEAVTIIDTLRRAKVNVVVASASTSHTVTCARGTKIVADTLLSNMDLTSNFETSERFSAMALPGGMPGAKNLAEAKPLQQYFNTLNAKELRKGLLVGAICAAPAVVLDKNLFPILGVDAKDIHVTCYPSFQDGLKHSSYKTDRVVVSNFDEGGKVKSGNMEHGKDFVIVTSQGPGTALEFSIKLVELLCGQKTASEVKEPMLAHF